MLWMNDDQPIQVNPKELSVQDFVHEDRGMNTQTGKNKTTAKFQFSFSDQPKLMQVTLTNPTKKLESVMEKELAKELTHYCHILPWFGSIPSAGFVKIVSSRFCVTMPLVPVQSPLT